MESLTGFTVGVDLADRASAICVVGPNGEVVSRETIPTDPDMIRQRFSRGVYDRVVIEACNIASWVGWELQKCGQRVIVAHSRSIALIHKSSRKNDRNDAEKLARLARVDEELVHPTHLRPRERAEVMSDVRGRATLVENRTRLVNSARSIAKTFARRLLGSTPGGIPAAIEQLADIEPTLYATLHPLGQAISEISRQVRLFDKKLAKHCERFPEARRALQVHGVGPLTALTFVLVVDDARRFPRTRDIGAYLGLAPKQDQTGQTDPALRISKAGHRYLRALLVQCARRILMKKAPDSDLKRWGAQIAARGGKRAKHVAAVAVARRLAVILLAMWKNETDYVAIREVAVNTAA
jgi:transposase